MSSPNVTSVDLNSDEDITFYGSLFTLVEGRYHIVIGSVVRNNRLLVYIEPGKGPPYDPYPLEPSDHTPLRDFVGFPDEEMQHEIREYLSHFRIFPPTLVEKAINALGPYGSFLRTQIPTSFGIIKETQK